MYHISSIRHCGYYFFRCSFLCSYYSRVAFISTRAYDCAATIRGWRLFQPELTIVQLLFEGGVYFAYDSAATIRGQCLFQSELAIVQLLFEGGVYSKKYCMQLISTPPSMAVW